METLSDSLIIVGAAVVVIALFWFLTPDFNRKVEQPKSERQILDEKIALICRVLGERGSPKTASYEDHLVSMYSEFDELYHTPVVTEVLINRALGRVCVYDGERFNPGYWLQYVDTLHEKAEAKHRAQTQTREQELTAPVDDYEVFQGYFPPPPPSQRMRK